jgi:hypothetical protein
MMSSTRRLPVLFYLALYACSLRSVLGQVGTTQSGCICVGPCSRTITTLTAPWCTTSLSPVSADEIFNDCVTSRYSPQLRAWWDYCQVNVTSEAPEQSLETLTSSWAVMTASTTAALASVYLVAGCTATVLTTPQSTMLWLPCAAALIGACHGALIGGISSLFISLIFFSMPYAINVQVGVSIGLAIAIFLAYAALGRHREPPRALHASVYED